MKSSLLSIGVIGSIVTGICCFTPLLVVVLGIVGLTSLTAFLDVVLLPAFIVFVTITILALVQRRRNA